MDRFATSSVLCFARRSNDQITWSMGFIFKVDEKLFPVYCLSLLLIMTIIEICILTSTCTKLYVGKETR